MRGSYSTFCTDALKDAGKTVNDMPLKQSGAGVTISEEELKAYARATTFQSPAELAMFAVLSSLFQKYTLSKDPFDGYVHLNLVVWFLIQVALEKRLVRSLRLFALWLVDLLCAW